MSINESLTKLTTMMSERDKTHQDFIKAIILLSSTLFGVLVSFYNKHDNIYINICFALALSLLAIGILFGAISLYSHVRKHHRLFDKYKQAVIEQLSSNAEHAKPVFENPSRFFSVCETISYVSLCSAVLVFCVYTVIYAVIL